MLNNKIIQVVSISPITYIAPQHNIFNKKFNILFSLNDILLQQSNVQLQLQLRRDPPDLRSQLMTALEKRQPS